jgi:hypothetical protein
MALPGVFTCKKNREKMAWLKHAKHLDSSSSESNICRCVMQTSMDGIAATAPGVAEERLTHCKNHRAWPARLPQSVQEQWKRSTAEQIVGVIASNVKARH